jgi:hypothetical protein
MQCAITVTQTAGPIFSEETANSECYVSDILCFCFRFSFLRELWKIMQDGATTYTAKQGV